MNQNHFFRISFSYFILDEQTNKLKKEKKEVLASAVNYTDAECLAMEILPDLQQDSDDVTYKITLIEKSLLIALNSAMRISDTLTRGLFNYYFEEEEDKVSLFKVTVDIKEPREKGDPKIVKEDWWVPAKTSKAAYDIMQSLLLQIETREFTLKNITFDTADEIFVTEQEHKNILYQSESANII